MNFPPLHIVEPTTEHTNTAILLHGRSSNGPEFASELFESRIPLNAGDEARNLAECLPSWRLVFPTSAQRWASVFQQEWPSWFDVHSLTNISEKQELQVDGLRESVQYMMGVLKDEIDRLGGQPKRVVLGGFSQGAATALWTFICGSVEIPGKLGGLVQLSGWLPFAENIEGLLTEADATAPNDHSTSPAAALCVVQFLRRTLTLPHISVAAVETPTLLSTPVFLAHGTDDAWVDVSLGRQVRGICRRMGLDIEWREYSGAVNEGHWVKEPEECIDIVTFLKRVQDPGP